MVITSPVVGNERRERFNTDLSQREYTMKHSVQSFPLHYPPFHCGCECIADKRPNDSSDYRKCFYVIRCEGVEFPFVVPDFAIGQKRADDQAKNVDNEI
jgi:hypothetical protein